MAKIALRNNGNPYLYEEVTSVSSAAIGLDLSDSGKLKFVVSTSPDVTPQGVDLKLTIDPSTNGNITFTPDGLGNVVVDNGNLSLTAGNFTMPFTNAAGTEGMLLVNGNSFINTLGPGNVFVGTGAGNLTLNTGAALFNTVIGSVSLQSLTDGSNNVVAGTSSMQALTTGIDNISVGASTLRNLVSGNNNIAIGGGAAINYTGAESDNIIINNAGVLGESNAIHIGTQGSGPGQQNAAYIAGIHGVTPGGGGLEMAIIDSNGQLGSQAIPSGVIAELDGNTGTATGSTVNVIAATTEGTSLITGDNVSTLTLTFSDADSNTVIGTSAFSSTHTPASALENTGVGALNLNAVTTGFDNSAFGASALNALTTGQFNSAFGSFVLSLITASLNNAGFGSGCLSALTAGNSNSAFGTGALAALDTGGNNVAFGFNSGLNYVGAESSNILISNAGTLGDNNTIRIGTQGSGAGQQNLAFMAGIHGVTPGGASIEMMVIDSSGQMGSQAIPGATITITGDSGGALGPASAFTFTGGTTGLTFAGAGTTETLGGTLAIANGGTNATSMANTDGVVYYDGTRLVTTAVGTATHVLTSNGAGLAPTFQAVPSSGMVWSEQTGATLALAVANGYIMNRGTLITATLPATAAVGDIIALVGKGVGGWLIAQNSGQTIHFGNVNTTTGAGGSLASSAQYDCVEIICTTANTDFVVRSSIGNLTVV